MMGWYLSWEYHTHIGMTQGFSLAMPVMLTDKMRWLYNLLFKVFIFYFNEIL
jgi:hypothetical protein